MINGMHAIVYSTDADADRAFFRDVLGYPSADAGGGWLIFALPPAELAVHPTDGAPQHELFFMCDDVEATVAELQAKGVAFEDGGAVSDERWGLTTTMLLPSGAKVGVYQPLHDSPIDRATTDA